MCRFGGAIGDPEFRKVTAAIQRIAEPILSQDRAEYMDLCRELLLKSLEFHRMDMRYFVVENPERETCRWLLEMPEYINWRDARMLEDHHGLLWIRGKPGAGKSTLAKFAVAQAEMATGKIIAKFFFNARGTSLEKCTAGMYRSLLLQIITAEPKFIGALDFLVPKYNPANSKPSQIPVDWNVQILKAVLERIVLRLEKRKLECFIDALDECDEDQIRDMVHFLGDIGNGIQPRPAFYVWFTSRHYPHITVPHGLTFTLEHQGGHSQDIYTYLHHRLCLGNSALDDNIRSHILHKASGVFMWVVLVVSILNREYDSGRLHALQRRLSQLPEDLHALFREILSRDRSNVGELLFCILWVLFSSRPLTPTEIYFAILAGVEPGLSFEWFLGHLREQHIERFILNSSKGLVEVIGHPQNRVVQFIHESVRTFFLKESGLHEAGLDYVGTFEGYGHEQLKNCCEQYVGLDSIPLNQTSRRHTFLRYAVENILYHSNEAQRHGTSQREFMSRFSYGNGACSCIFGPVTPVPTPNHIIRQKYCFLIGHKLWQTPIFDTPRNGTRSPFQEAIITRKSDVICAVLMAEASRHSHLAEVQDAYDEFRQEAMKGTAYPSDHGLANYASTYSRQSILFDAMNDPRLLKFLLSIDQFDLSAADRSGFTPITAMVWGQKTDCIAVLLASKRVNVNQQDALGRTALCEAARLGYTEVSEVLLEYGFSEPIYTSPLNSPGLVVREQSLRPSLLQGLDLNAHDGEGYSPLVYACRYGQVAMVELLLQTRMVNINDTDNDGRTPLWWSVAGPLSTNVKAELCSLLLSTRLARPGLVDNYGCSPLEKAHSLFLVHITTMLRLYCDSVGS